MSAKTERVKFGDILAVLLPDGSKGLVEVHIYARCLSYPGYTTEQVRTTVLEPTGPYGKLWYITPLGDRSTPYEYTLPVVSDPTYGQDWHCQPLNTFQILNWDELQPLTIVPLYRRLDAAHGAEYTKYTYESDRGSFVAAKNYLRDQGYDISQAMVEVKEPFQITRLEWKKDHYQVRMPASHTSEIWTCQKLVAQASKIRNCHEAEQLDPQLY